MFFAREVKSQNYFSNPVKYKIRLTGSFGELRKNHFHTGIDIKSSGNYKLNRVYAIADGYVSRIRIGPGGYGKAIYINHPNGITSVYAHLDHFSKKLAVIAKKIQYDNKSFIINPDSLNIPVEKGEFIGQIGNTGRSFGPHLHFELRNTETEHPINPFLFGIKPGDKRVPKLLRVKLVALDTSFNVLNSKIYKLQKSKYGNYITKPFTIKYGAWRLGIEVLGYDKMNNASNKNGIYKMSMKVDGQKVYEFRMDSLDFDKMKTVNAFIDYKSYVDYKSRYIRLYKLPGNDLNILLDSLNGLIDLYKEKYRKIEISAEDFEGNKSKLFFELKRDTVIRKTKPLLFNNIVKYGEQKDIKDKDFILSFDKGDLFKDLYLFTKSQYMDSSFYSADISIFTNYEPFKNDVDLYIKPVIFDSSADKMTIIKIEGSKEINYGSDTKYGYIHTLIDSYGTYKIALDTIAPVIKPVVFGKILRKTRKIIFKITDNFQTAGIASELKYNGFIDGKWVLFEYDKKNKTIKHTFEKNLKKGQHHLKIIVEDDKGNKSLFESSFIK